MRRSRYPAVRLRPICIALMWSALALPAYADPGAGDLLASLLERGLIAPEDYAAEMARQGIPAPTMLAVAEPEVPRRGGAAAAHDTMVDYQWLVAMNDSSEKSPREAQHGSASQHGKDGHAGHNHFEGGYVVITEEWKRPSVTVGGEKIKVSESAPSIGAGYTFSLGEKTTLGLKATVDMKNGEFGSGELAGRGAETKVLEKSHYSLAVEPGYVVGEHTLVFGILAYHHARTGFEDGIQTKTISGFGYGVGFKRTLMANVFLMGELQRVTYGEVTVDGSTVKPRSSTAALGLGYHF